VYVREPKAGNVRAYLKAMNLIGALSGQALDNVSLSLSEAQHVPLCPLRSREAADEVAARLRDILLARLPPTTIASGVGMTLGVTLAELVENFQRHAESETLAFVCAQFYPEHDYREQRQPARHRGGVFEVAIADTGIGIARSLSASPELQRLIEAGANPCELATRLGVTSKAAAHSGLGLWVTSRLAEVNGGVFMLVSEGDSFTIHRGRRRALRGRSAWPGTFVGLGLRLRGPLDVNTVYAELGAVEQP
jgi:hypothetical protein